MQVINPNVRTHFLEGEYIIKELKYLRFKWHMIPLAILFGLSTAGFGFLVLYWYISIRRKFFFADAQNIEETTHFWVREWDDTYEILTKRSQSTKFEFAGFHSKTLTTFKNRNLTYYYDEQAKVFTPLVYGLEKLDLKTIHTTHMKGLDTNEITTRRDLFGKCFIDIKIPNALVLFFREVTNPFTLFQFFAFIVWFYEEYYTFTAILLFLTVASALKSMWSARANLIKIKDMSKFTTKVKVLRRKDKEAGGETMEVDSSQLVPGDFVELKDQMEMPCDVIMLAGEVAVDESSLTGESVPVVKTSLPQIAGKLYNPSSDKKYTLFQGTKIVQNHRAFGFVSAIGFQAYKGQLIRGILYPLPYNYKFVNDAYKILFVLGILGTLLSIPGLYELAHYLTPDRVVVKYLDLLTTMVPPALPVALLAGNAIATKRLQTKGVACISTNRIVAAGLVDTICFDKTGTLTEDHMDVKGFSLCTNNQFVKFFSDTKQDILPLFNPTFAVHVMGTCHSVRKLDGQNDNFIGDPMEIEMFKFSKAKFVEVAEKDQEIHAFGVEFNGPSNDGVMTTAFVLKKQFDFENDLQRMSVLVTYKEMENKKFLVFTKGSPEKLKNLCRIETIPNNFEEQLESFTEQGYRVLALAYKQLDDHSVNNIVEVDKLTREDCESELIFIGFLVFENKIREGTAETIDKLRAANLKMKIVSGDNPLTTAAVAKSLYLIHQTSDNISCEIIQNHEELSNPAIQIKTLVSNKKKHDPDNVNVHSGPDLPRSPGDVVLVPREDDQSTGVQGLHGNLDQGGMLLNLKEYKNDETKAVAFMNSVLHALDNTTKSSFIFTGDIFEFLIVNAPKSQKIDELLQKILYRAVIFSRMQPNHKSQLVETIQRVSKSHVAMVGDGANDCGALRTADVGLSLSDLEAPCISAPFTSRNKTVASVVDLLLEGRCTLAVNFQNFLYVNFYAIIEATSTAILYYFVAMFSDGQFIWFDLFTSTTMLLVLAMTGPSKKLQGSLPPDTLMKTDLLITLFGGFAIQLTSQLAIISILTQQGFYVPANDGVTPTQENNTMTHCFESTSLFLFTCLLYISGGFIVAQYNSKFQQNIFRNLWFVGTAIVLTTYVVLMFFVPVVRYHTFEITDNLPINFFAFLFVAGFVVSIIWLIFQRFLVSRIGKKIHHDDKQQAAVALANLKK